MGRAGLPDLNAVLLEVGCSYRIAGVHALGEVVVTGFAALRCRTATLCKVGCSAFGTIVLAMWIIIFKS